MLNFAWLPEAALLKMFTEYIRAYLETRETSECFTCSKALTQTAEVAAVKIHPAMGSAATLGAPAVLVAFMGPRI